MNESSFKLTLGVGLMIGGGFVGIASLFLPWVSAGIFSVSGLQIGGLTPIAVALVSLIGIATGLVVAVDSGSSLAARFLAGSSAALALLWGVVNLADLNKVSNSGLGLSIDVTSFIGIGVWTAFGAGIAIIAGASLGTGAGAEAEDSSDMSSTGWRIESSAHPLLPEGRSARVEHTSTAVSVAAIEGDSTYPPVSFSLRSGASVERNTVRVQSHGDEVVLRAVAWPGTSQLQEIAQTILQAPAVEESRPQIPPAVATVAPRVPSGSDADPAIGQGLHGFAAEAMVVADQAGSVANIELLRQLASLRDAGIISQEEFDSKKAELLNRI